MSNFALLNARVRAVNECHRYCNQIRPKLLEIFAPFVGCKVIKKDGEFLECIKKLFPDFDSKNTQVYRYRSSYAIGFTIKVHEIIDGKVAYYDRTIIVGSLKGQVLDSLEDEDREPLFADYDANVILELRKRHQKIKDDADQALSELHPFGEYDR